MRIIVDEKCMPHFTDEARTSLRDICQANGYTLTFGDVRAKSGVHNFDTVAIAGLGIASLSLIVALLQLATSAPKKEINRDDLLREVHAFLLLKGASGYAFAFEVGFENLVSRNGLPCVVGVVLPSGEKAYVYLGTDGNKIVASTLEYDWRHYS